MRTGASDQPLVQPFRIAIKLVCTLQKRRDGFVRRRHLPSDLNVFVAPRTENNPLAVIGLALVTFQPAIKRFMQTRQKSWRVYVHFFVRKPAFHLFLRLDMGNGNALPARLVGLFRIALF